jgi:excisionase family DNA binding protein
MSNDISGAYITYAAAASELGVSLTTFRGMVRDGIIPAYRFTPRVVRIRVADLDAAARPVIGGEGGIWTRTS